MTPNSNRSKIIRAWKNREFRQSLSASELARLPEHPAGLIDLSDADLDGVTGGLPTPTYGTVCSLGWRCIPRPSIDICG